MVSQETQDSELTLPHKYYWSNYWPTTWTPASSTKDSALVLSAEPLTIIVWNLLNLLCLVKQPILLAALQ